MRFFKRYFVIVFLTLFVVGTTASIAMAYCDDSHPGHNSQSVEESSNGSAAHQPAPMNHDTAHNDPSGANSDGSCSYECDGSLCNNRNLVPLHFTLGLYESADTLHIEKDINPTEVFFAKIPQPPKELS